MAVKQIPVTSLADSVMNIVLDGQSYNLRMQWNGRDESWMLYLGIAGQDFKFKSKMRVGVDLLKQYSGYDDVPQGMLYVLDLNKGSGRLQRDSFSSGRMVLVYITESSKIALDALNGIADTEITVEANTDDRFTVG